MNPDPTTVFLPVTRLNEGDTAVLMRDAVDAIVPLDSGLPGCVVHLRGGHILRVSETVEQLMEALSP